MKTTTCKCAYCKEEFEKPTAEWKRSEKRKAKHFCGLSCFAKWRNYNCPNPGNPAVLIANNKRDKFTSFRYFMRRAIYRKRDHRKRNIRKREVNITLEYLKNLWEEQNSICPLSGIELILPLNSDAFPSESLIWKRASLDRINSSKGYIKGNVRFICWMANVAKSQYSDDMVIEFCHAVAQNNPVPKIITQG